MSESDNELQQYEQTYIAALALYDVLRASGMIQVRRAELRQGEVKAEPIDFVADIEMRATNTLSTKEWLLKWWDILEEPWRYPDLPKEIQRELGKVFFENDLGIEGHYRMLYFKVKNQLERRKLKEEEDARAEQLFSGDERDTDYNYGRGAGSNYPNATEPGGVDGETEETTPPTLCD